MLHDPSSVSATVRKGPYADDRESGRIRPHEVAVETNVLIQSQLAQGHTEVQSQQQLPSGVPPSGVPFHPPGVKHPSATDKEIEEIRKLVENEFGNSIPEELRSRIKKKNAELTKSIFELQNTNALSTMIKEEVDVLETGALPTSCKKSIFLSSQS